MLHAKLPRILSDLAGFGKVCWAMLCEDQLHEHCILGGMQDQNETFNNFIWKYCPKTDLAGLTSVHMATLLAMLTFNKGLCFLVPLYGRLGGKVGPFCTRYLVANDATCILNAQAKVTERQREGGSLCVRLKEPGRSSCWMRRE